MFLSSFSFSVRSSSMARELMYRGRSAEGLNAYLECFVHLAIYSDPYVTLSIAKHILQSPTLGDECQHVCVQLYSWAWKLTPQLHCCTTRMTHLPPSSTVAQPEWQTLLLYSGIFLIHVTSQMDTALMAGQLHNVLKVKPIKVWTSWLYHDFLDHRVGNHLHRSLHSSQRKRKLVFIYLFINWLIDWLVFKDRVLQP